MELIERPNMRTVHYLNSISFETFKTDCINDATNSGQQKPILKDIQTWYSVLKQFCKTNIKTKGITKRIYSYSMTTPAGLGGRLFSGGSMQGIWSVYRGSLMNGIGTDIDMANAHPVILRYICKKHNIDCPQLEYYINNRDVCLTKFSSRSVGKTAYLMATNNDKYSVKRGMPDHFKNYDKEMKRIQSELVRIPDYHNLIETIPEYKATDNYNGCAINRILCYYENIVLQHAIHIINNKGLEIAILMFDGCMIYGDHYDNTTLLEDITKYVEEQMGGLNMTWCYKECDTSLVIPDEFDENEYTHSGELRFVQDDNQAANMIISDLKDVLICSNKEDGRVFYKHNHVWICDANQINNHLLNYIISSNICRVNENQSYVPYAQNVKSARNIRDTVLVKISAIDYEFDIYDKLHSTTKGRIAFKDGVLDFKTKQFHKWENIPFEYYTPIMIRYEFEEYFKNPNKDDIATIKRDVFGVLFGDKLDVALHFLSRAIAGHCEDKNWATYLGNRNCGKGVKYDGLKSAFEEYVQTFELQNIMYERNRDTQEASKKLYWILDLEFCRLAISQEVPDSPNMKTDCKMLKKLAGGGDTIVARRNFDRIDTHITIDTTFMMDGNTDLKLDSKDANEHRLELQSVIQFKTQEEIDALREQGASELVLSAYRVKDPTIKDKIKSDAWKRAIVYLLYENYKNKPVSIIREIDCDDELVSLRSLIDREYEITRSDTDIILVSDMVDELSCNKKKLIAELNSMNVFVKKCKVRDCIYRDKMCFFGIKKREPASIDGSTDNEEYSSYGSQVGK
jgi:hypothetical protein